MEMMKYSKVFALAAVFALVAGCGGGATTAEEASQDVVADEVMSADAAFAESAEDARGAAASAMDSVTIPNVKTVYFDFDKSNIRSEFYSVLNAHAAYLMANSNAKVVLEGHTDERGTREYNMALGERRGVAVQRYLSLQGVSSSQMEVVSYGEERPAVRGQTREAYDKNRRVEVIYR